ncbi:MAG: ribosome biogenesis GTPase YlqF [Ruminococcaceae bacterium]|nr:ribosome biogenesis GTPase YlqF [Oscillospiraceae bacterium]
MAQNPIQWFPGHMAKTRRVIKECLPQVDVVIELLDARIPYSSKNPEIEAMIEQKPRITLLTKATLADPDVSKKWAEYYNKRGSKTVIIDSVTGYGIDALDAAIKEVMAEKLERYREKGMDGRKLKAMMVGIPNVGKSSLINKLAGGKKAKVENRPGVTLAKQWVPTSVGLDLLDMPGVLWPKFEDEKVGQNLAMTGAIRDQIIDIEEIAMLLCARLMEVAPKAFCERYKLDYDEVCELDGYDLFNLVGRKRGFLISGGEINSERTANMLLEEFRSAKIGRISLEKPDA